MALTDVVIDIHQRETGKELSSELVGRLRELAADFGMEAKRTWLDSIFEDLQNGRAVQSAVCFEPEPDPSSYLAELVDLLDWEIRDEGEYQEINFRRLGWRVFISHEALTADGRHASSYIIEPLSAT